MWWSISSVLVSIGLASRQQPRHKVYAWLPTWAKPVSRVHLPDVLFRRSNPINNNTAKLHPGVSDEGLRSMMFTNVCCATFALLWNIARHAQPAEHRWKSDARSQANIGSWRLFLHIVIMVACSGSFATRRYSDQYVPYHHRVPTATCTYKTFHGEHGSVDLGELHGNNGMAWAKLGDTAQFDMSICLDEWLGCLFIVCTGAQHLFSQVVEELACHTEMYIEHAFTTHLPPKSIPQLQLGKSQQCVMLIRHMLLDKNSCQCCCCAILDDWKVDASWCFQHSCGI